MSTPSPTIQAVEGSLAWRGSEIAQTPGWHYVMNASEIAEVQAALAACAELPRDSVTAGTFPLPTLSARLRDLRQILESGVGSCLLGGWPTEDHDVATNERVFWGLSHHLGTAISQSAQGEKIFHVRDSGFKMGHPKARGPNTSRGLSF
ncbi:MAG: TauD/TfdA family dioxygenase, partial [Acidobacteriota bacterium]